MEQEGNGFEANTRHVLTHLAKDVALKDFSDPELVETEIAPDAVQYALRLGRWSGVRTSDMTELTEKEDAVVDSIYSRMESLPFGLAPYIGAMGILAKNLHDSDHKKDREVALGRTYGDMRSASRLLVYAATTQAHQLGFGLVSAFDKRLMLYELALKYQTQKVYKVYYY
ncbi:MAG: hypothetical protein WDN66_05855 [Candidatus Saccharibacteria bacterium]